VSSPPFPTNRGSIPRFVLPRAPPRLLLHRTRFAIVVHLQVRANRPPLPHVHSSELHSSHTRSRSLYSSPEASPQRGEHARAHPLAGDLAVGEIHAGEPSLSLCVTDGWAW
jgi:hypothetical protein